MFSRPFTCNYIFRPDGSSGAENTGTRVGISSWFARQPRPQRPQGSFIGGNGDNASRWSARFRSCRNWNGIRRIWLAISKYRRRLFPFIEAKYVRTNSFSQGGSGPAFLHRLDDLGWHWPNAPVSTIPICPRRRAVLLTSQFLSVIAAGFDPATGYRLYPHSRCGRQHNDHNRAKAGCCKRCGQWLVHTSSSCVAT